MRRTLSLGAVLAILAGTLVLGLALKRPCIDGTEWSGQQWYRFCYTDIVPLYGTEQLEGDRLPYLDPCEQREGANCDEYPVLTMYFMRTVAWFTDDPFSFFWGNALVLTALAVVVTVLLYRMVGARALVFVAAPTLAIHAYINWDLLAVAAATAGLWSFSRGRDRAAGLWLAVGAAAKLYPSFFVIPLALQRWRDGDRRAAGEIVGVSALGWLAFNLPFALLARDPWLEFFRLSSSRPADWDSLWFVSCQPFLPLVAPWCRNPGIVNVGVAAVLVAAVVLAWSARRDRDPDFPRWTLIVPFLILFLVTGKVYSPQFSLWLLPILALVRVDLRVVALFGVLDAAVFFTRFGWFATMNGNEIASGEQFSLAIVLRAILLVGLVIAWTRGALDPRPDPMLPDRGTTGKPDRTPAGAERA